MTVNSDLPKHSGTLQVYCSNLGFRLKVKKYLRFPSNLVIFLVLEGADVEGEARARSSSASF